MKTTFVPRVLAAFLAMCLSLSSPAFALRTQEKAEAGLEELTQALQSGDPVLSLGLSPPTSPARTVELAPPVPSQKAIQITTSPVATGLEEKQGISRRDFLVGGGAFVASGAIASGVSGLHSTPTFFSQRRVWRTPPSYIHHDWWDTNVGGVKQPGKVVLTEKRDHSGAFSGYPPWFYGMEISKIPKGYPLDVGEPVEFQMSTENSFKNLVLHLEFQLRGENMDVVTATLENKKKGILGSLAIRPETEWKTYSIGFNPKDHFSDGEYLDKFITGVSLKDITLRIRGSVSQQKEGSLSIRNLVSEIQYEELIPNPKWKKASGTALGTFALEWLGISAAAIAAYRYRQGLWDLRMPWLGPGRREKRRLGQIARLVSSLKAAPLIVHEFFPHEVPQEFGPDEPSHPIWAYDWVRNSRYDKLLRVLIRVVTGDTQAATTQRLDLIDTLSVEKYGDPATRDSLDHIDRYLKAKRPDLFRNDKTLPPTTAGLEEPPGDQTPFARGRSLVERLAPHGVRVWQGLVQADDPSQVASDERVAPLIEKPEGMEFTLEIPASSSTIRSLAVNLPEPFILWVHPTLRDVVPAQWGVRVEVLPENLEEARTVLREKVRAGDLVLLDKKNYAPSVHRSWKAVLAEEARQGLWVTEGELSTMDRDEFAITLQILRNSGEVLPALGPEREIEGTQHRFIYA